MAKLLHAINLFAIRKQQRQMELGIGLRCVLYIISQVDELLCKGKNVLPAE